ncbi:MAG: ATPase, partial [Blautia sp.]|nr:ATPase [Blautia sp.]
MGAAEKILQGQTALGIEFGSTRIKGVLTDYDGNVLAIGTYDWENQFIDGIWTYSLEAVDQGLQGCYASLAAEVKKNYGVSLEKLGALGISAMMHGYIALDKEDKQLAIFQTWRNTNTTAAADELTELFQFNIPLRWSIAHLYQRILDGEEHVKNLDFVATLAAYVHYKLSGQRVVGIGDGAGMFPINSETHDYNEKMVKQFDELVAPRGYSWKLRDLFPKVLVAGENAGSLTEAGAKLLDPTGTLQAGVPMC